MWEMNWPAGILYALQYRDFLTELKDLLAYKFLLLICFIDPRTLRQRVGNLILAALSHLLLTA